MRAAAAAGSRHSRWPASSGMNTRTMIRKKLLLGLVSAALLAGCANSSAPARKAAQSPYGKLLQDATAYVNSLEEQGKLPGFHKGEHGSLSSMPEPVWEKGVTFPVSVVLRGTKEGDDSFYRYTIIKLDAGA